MKQLLETSKWFILFFSLGTLALMLVYGASVRAADAPATAAGAPVGQVIWIKGGSVKALQASKAPRVLQRRSPVYVGDVISTDKKATGEIAFTDSSVVSLREDTEFKIDEFSYKKGAAAKNKSVMNVIKGGFRTITGAIPKENPDAYRINTPMATIGVRGTQYSAVISTAKGLLLKMDKGSIEVANSAGKMIFSKCKESQSSKCIRFGAVKSSTSSPEGLSSMPSEFDNEPSISAAPAGFGEPGSGSDGMGGGGSQTVSGFCIGLLHSIKAYFAAWA